MLDIPIIMREMSKCSGEYTQRHFNIHGVFVAAKSSIPFVLETMDDRWKPYHSSCHNRTDINILAHNVFWSSLNKIKKEFSWLRSRPLWGDHDGDLVRLTDGASVALINQKQKHIELFLDSSTLSDSLFWSRTFLPLPLLLLLRVFGFHYVHGALVAKGDNSLLILGEGGQGKSTLAAAFMKSGWQIIADDNLLFKLNSKQECWGTPFEQELSVQREVLTLLGIGISSTEVDNGLKERISLSTLPTCWVRANAQPRMILLLADKPSPISPSDVFAHLLQENPLLFVNPSLAQTQLDVFQRLIAQSAIQTIVLIKQRPLCLENIATQAMNQIEMGLTSPPPDL